MISNYLPYIFGLTNLVIGVYLFLFSFHIYQPKVERTKVLLEKFGLLAKISSVLLILSGLYDLILPNPASYQIRNKYSQTEWTKNDRTILIKNCMRDAGPTAIKYPKIIGAYCACSMDEIMHKMTKERYTKNLSKSHEEQMKEIAPLFQDCVTEMKQQIDSVQQVIE